MSTSDIIVFCRSPVLWEIEDLAKHPGLFRPEDWAPTKDVVNMAELCGQSGKFMDRLEQLTSRFVRKKTPGPKKNS